MKNLPQKSIIPGLISVSIQNHQASSFILNTLLLSPQMDVTPAIPTEKTAGSFRQNFILEDHSYTQETINLLQSSLQAGIYEKQAEKQSAIFSESLFNAPLPTSNEEFDFDTVIQKNRITDRAILGMYLINQGIDPWENDPKSSRLPLAISQMLASGNFELLERSLKHPSAPSTLKEIMEKKVHPAIGENTAWEWILRSNNENLFARYFKEGGDLTSTMKKPASFYLNPTALRAAWDFGFWPKEEKKENAFIEKIKKNGLEHKINDEDKNKIKVLLQETGWVNSNQENLMNVKTHLEFLVKNPDDHRASYIKNWPSISLEEALIPGPVKYKRKNIEISAVALTMLLLMNSEKTDYLLSRSAGEQGRAMDYLQKSSLPTGAYIPVLSQKIGNKDVAGLALLFLSNTKSDLNENNIAFKIHKESLRLFGFENGTNGSDFQEFMKTHARSALLWANEINAQKKPNNSVVAFEIFEPALTSIFEKISLEEKEQAQFSLIETYNKNEPLGHFENISNVFDTPESRVLLSALSRTFGGLSIYKGGFTEQMNREKEDEVNINYTPRFIQAVEKLTSETPKLKDKMKEICEKIENLHLLHKEMNKHAKKTENTPRF